jgi:hypothetical protein
MSYKWITRSAIVLLLAAPAVCVAQPTMKAETQSLLSAFISYTDLRIHSVLQTLELLATTSEVKSGEWETMKGLLSAYQKADGGFVAWYVLPDGRYYTGDKGLMDATLRDREYFPDLMAGREVLGALVVSRSTGQRSAVVAVPLKQGGKVVGGIGVSLFLDRLASQVDSSLALGPDEGFFAVAANGLTTLHRKSDRHFLNPRELGRESLKHAVDEMLSMPSGETTYEFDNATKRAVYRRSALTQWTFAVTSNVPR